jgi:cytochrome c biogenesis protein
MIFRVFGGRVREIQGALMRSVWKFLSSIKLAIVLIILLTVASIIGTLIPQGRSVAEYSARYGSLASLVIALRLTTLYRSAWFLALLILLAANTIVCTLSRFGPKWRRAFRTAPDLDPKSVASMRSSCRFRLPIALETARERVEMELNGRHYVLHQSTQEGRAFLQARKRRLGWFGSDIVHLGLLVILAGGFVSGLASRKSELALADGQTAALPLASFELRLDKFETEYYPQGAVKDWKSTVTVLDGGAPVLTRTIEVNEPLKYRGVTFYQQGYGMNWDLARCVLELRKTGDPAFSRTVSLRVGDRSPVEGPDVTRIAVRRFVPDFVLGEGNQVQSRSEEPNNPAALVEAWKGEERVFSGWVFAKYPDFGQGHGTGEAAPANAPKIAVVLKDYSATSYSVIEAARDPGVTIIWIGCALISLGFFLAFYWPPREIRVVLEASPGRVDLAAGGQASKSRESFQAEFDAIFESIRRPA